MTRTVFSTLAIAGSAFALGAVAAFSMPPADADAVTGMHATSSHGSGESSQMHDEGQMHDQGTMPMDAGEMSEMHGQGAMMPMDAGEMSEMHASDEMRAFHAEMDPAARAACDEMHAHMVSGSGMGSR